MKDEAELPHMPVELAFVWEHFVELFNPGGVGMGPFRIPYQEMEAYCRMTRQHITPVETQILRDLSEKFIIVWNEKQEKEFSTPGAKPAQPTVEGKPVKMISMNDSKGLLDLFRRQGQKGRPIKKG